MTDKIKRMFVCMPRTGGIMDIDFHRSFSMLLSGTNQVLLGKNHGIVPHVLYEDSMPISENRNILVDACLEGSNMSDPSGATQKLKADLLLFLDTDMTFPSDMIFKLYELMQQKKAEVVSGMYFSKKEPYPSIFGRWADPAKRMYKPATYWPDIPFKVDVHGIGCMLIDTKVFKKLKRPYFEYQTNPMKPQYKNASEDMHFCRQLSDANVPIWVDPTIDCGHISKKTIFKAHREITRRNFETNMKGTDKEYYFKNICDCRKDGCPQSHEGERQEWELEHGVKRFNNDRD